MELVLKEISGELPTSHFELIKEGRKIGYLQLRHRPSHSNEFPEDFANHIYYEIEEEERGKGYGKELLRFGLEKAKEMEFKEVTVTCYEENVSSRKIIEANRGSLIGEGEDTGGNPILKYRILLD